MTSLRSLFLKWRIASVQGAIAWIFLLGLLLPASAGWINSQYSQQLDMQLVNGNPAICYYDSQSYQMRYVRSTNAYGDGWGTAVLLFTGVFPSPSLPGTYGRMTSMRIVNGRPAVAFLDASNGDLKFIRANDANGTAWGTPITVDSAGNVGAAISMEIIDGQPAITYHDYTNGDLRYIRATDADGTTWGSSQTLDSTGIVGRFTSMAVVNGYPAISYHDASNGDLRYIRAQDATGSTWGTPATVDSSGTNVTGLHTSLAVVDGMPAIAYYDSSVQDLRFVRAADADGSTWNSPVTLVSAGNSGVYASMAVIGGIPVVAFQETGAFDSKIIVASNASATAWEPVRNLMTLSSVGYGQVVREVAGRAAVAYGSSGPDTPSGLEFLRDATAEVSLGVGGSSLSDGGRIPFSALSGTEDAVLTVTNTGAGSLWVSGFGLDGPDASEFSVIGGTSFLLTPGEGTTRTVRFNPASAGLVSAVLHMTNQIPSLRRIDLQLFRSGDFAPAVDGTVRSIALQPDGKFVFGGSFSNVDGQPRRSFARYLADGVLDLTFKTEVNGTVYASGILPDGRVLAGGDYQFVQIVQMDGTTTLYRREGLVQLGTDGTPTSSDVGPAPGDVFSILSRNDNGFQFGGTFSHLGTPVTGNTNAYNGAAGFWYNIGNVGANGVTIGGGPGFKINGVYAISLQNDGSQTFGGNFTEYAADGRTFLAGSGIFLNVARFIAPLNPLTSFVPRPNGTVQAVATQPDGKILIGGTFTSIQIGSTSTNHSRSRLARLNTDGSVDTGFDPSPNGSIYAIALQTDGKIIIGGSFTTVQPSGSPSPVSRTNLARLNADGTLDTSFAPNPDGVVYALALRTNGRILVGGGFTSINGGTQRYLAELANDAATESLIVNIPPRVRWLRGGASPEIPEVIFEASTNGGASWTALGSGSRITGGWELPSPSLPASGILRARGLRPESGGHDSGLIESAASFPRANENPVAADDSAERQENRPIKIPISRLIQNDTDLDGDLVIFSGISGTSSNGVSISTDSGWVYYEASNASPNTTDTFSYTVRDEFGGTAAGTVTVTVRPAPASEPPTFNLISSEEGAFPTRNLTFQGAPRRSYRIYAQSTLGGPWTLLNSGSPVTAGNNGRFTVVDPNPLNSPTRYYRTAIVP